MILMINTLGEVAKVSIFEKESELSWPGFRNLHLTASKIEMLLKKTGIKKADLTGIVIYRGPGSFTATRVGVAIANALSFSLDIPLAYFEKTEKPEMGVKRLKSNPGNRLVLPFYDRAPNISKPKSSA